MYKYFISFCLCLSATQALSARESLPVDTLLSIEKQLNEVEITEKKVPQSLSVFKSINVATIPALSNLTTAGMLQKVPSLSLDMEGNLRLRGSNKVTLLFEGIPITLFEENRSDLLIQMPVELFSSILVLNILPTTGVNEGEAGAVDFLFAPSFNDKTESKINLALGSDNRYNGSVLLGYKNGKFRWQAGYDFRQEYRYRTYKKTTVDKTGIAQMNNNAGARPRTHLAMLNAQYLVSPSDILDFTGLFQFMNYNRLGNINNTKTNTSGVIVANVLRQRANSEKQTGNSEGLSWKHLWKEQKASFEATLNYDNFGYDQGNNYTNKRPGTEIVLAQDRLFIEQDKHQWFASAKLSKQFSDDFSAQIGYTGQWHKDSYSASDDDLINGVWVHNMTKSNTYRLVKNLHCGFVELNYKSGAWNYLLGIQTQFDNRVGSSDGVSGQINKDNLYLLPHLEISFKQSGFSSWSLRYQERINRPFMTDLNPFTDSSDATYVHKGNSSLRNEQVHIAELSNTSRIRNITLNPVLFYRYRYDQITDVATQVNGSTVWTKDNVNHSQDIGLELNAEWKPFSFLTADASVTGYHYQIDGTRQGYGMEGKYSVDAKGSLTAKLPLGLTWEVYGYYTDRQLTVQGEIAALGSVGSSLSYTGLKKHLNVAISIDNAFDSLEEKTMFSTVGTQQTIYRNRDARILWISAGYRL